MAVWSKLFVSVEIVNIFLPINLNMFWCSKEVSHWDSSFECPQNMLLLRNKKINFSYTLLSRGPWLYAELLVPKNEPALEILVLITLTRQNTKYGCRWSLRPKFRPLALLDMWAWIFKGGFSVCVISTKNLMSWLISSGLQIRMHNENYFPYFSTKTYVVGTQKNRLNETVLLSTQNICLNWWVRK